MSKPGPATVLVVVVNFRTTDLVVDCLRSLEPETVGDSGVRVEVVDNASGDGSAERIAGAIRDGGWGRWASVRALDRNGGFARGNNEAIGPALAADDPPRYVLLLNPDTVVRAGAVAALVDFMEGRPDVGIAGSRLEDPDGTPQRSAFRFPSIPGEFEAGMRLGLVTRVLSRYVVAPPVPEGRCAAGWVSGAAMIVRREVFDAVGLLDDGFFLYYEEVDFCLRARRAGWPCWYVPESRVVHLVGQSTGVVERGARQKRRPAYWFRARRRYFLRNHGVVRTFAADLAWASAFSTFRVRRVLQRKPDLDPHRMLLDFIGHSFLPRASRR